MSDKFKTRFQELLDTAVPVSGQTAESLCLKLFLQQIGHIKDLPSVERQKAEERIGEIGCFISKSPVLFNEFSSKVQLELTIKPKQLQQLMQRAKKKMREENAKIRNTAGDNDKQGAGEDSESTKLKSELFKISQQMLPAEIKEKMMADAVLKCLADCGRLYRHKAMRTFDQCLFFNNTQKRLLPLTGDEFQSWLSYFTGINMSQKVYSYVHNAILVEALSGTNTQEIIPERFWAARENAFYMSRGDGHVVKIVPGEVSLEDNGVDGVLFASGYTLNPWKLTAPKDPFIKCRIFSDMKLVSPHGLDLLRTWCVALPANQQTKPPIVLTGPVGGGKTKSAGGVFDLLGIFPRITKTQDDGEANFWTSMDLGGLFCLDNADTKIKWLPDALAAAATGGKHEKRQLYSDSGIVRQQANSALIVTSANPAFASDAGLADRLIVIRMERRDDTEDMSLTREVIENRDSGLSWIAHTLAKALSDNAPVEKGLNKRHPDFATLAVKIGRATGREKETMDALRNAEADKSLFNVENDIIGAAILALIKVKGPFTGYANDLLKVFKETDPSFNNFRWSSRGLAKHLSNIWPHLVTVFKADRKIGHGGGFQYSFSTSGDSGDSESGFSYKPSSDPLRGELAKRPFNVTKVTNRPASASSPIDGGISTSETHGTQKEIVI